MSKRSMPPYRPVNRFLIAGIFLILSNTQYLPKVNSFELTPVPTKSEAYRAKREYGILFRLQYPAVEFALHRFSVPVHEALTHVAHDCNYSLEDCSDINHDFAQSGIIAGVRWNDDPPFQFSPGSGRYNGCPRSGDKLSTVSFALRTVCWYEHFKDVAALASVEPKRFLDRKGTLLARSHFGDLQFLHSMASQIGEDPKKTKTAILIWLEFAWRVQTGRPDFIPGETPLGKVPVSGFRKFFPSNEQRTVIDLFTVGRPWMRHQISEIAFGSLLHVIQDSFAGGHTNRRSLYPSECANSEIVGFHTYAGQSRDEHKLRDTIEYAKRKVSTVTPLDGNCCVFDQAR